MKYLFTVIPLFLLTLLSCQKIEDIENSKVFISVNKAPTGGEVNKELEFELSFGVRNGCGQFSKFIEHKKDNTITIGIETIYVGNGCTMDLPVRTVKYKFSTLCKGIYNFRFKSKEKEYTTKTVTIN